MLNKIKFLVWLIFLLLVAYFVTMNTDSVSINLFPGYQTIPLPLSIIIIVSLIIGAVLALILTIGDWIKFKVEVSKLKKQLQHCEKEKQSLIQSQMSTQATENKDTQTENIN